MTIDALVQGTHLRRRDQDAARQSRLNVKGENMALEIFISHKMPTDTPVAEEIGSRLSLYAGNEVRVTHAGQFPYGVNWRKLIEDAINKADWFILLCTNQDEDWAFCLFECGLFQARMQASPENKRLITFCRKAEDVSSALEEFNALVMSQEAVVKLLEDIYVNEPLRLAPKIGKKDLELAANAIYSAFVESPKVEANFDVATNLVFELSMTKENELELRRGRIPVDSILKGTKDWQHLFGKDGGTGAWLWKDLSENWPYRETYEFLIARMMYEAFHDRIPKSAQARPAESNEIYRLTLRRYERLVSQKYRFLFTLAPLTLPFEVPRQSTQSQSETLLYHLLTLSWYFRRRVVDQLYERLLQVKAMPSPDIGIVTTLFDDIKYELMEISAQSFVRGIDNPLSVRLAFGEDDKEAQEMISSILSWESLRRQIFASTDKGVAGLSAIARDLYQMSIQNYNFCRKVAQSYSTMAQKLSQPRKPEFGITNNNVKRRVAEVSKP